MRTVFREWQKSPIALLFISIHFVCSMAYQWISARLIIIITRVIDDPEFFVQKIWIIVAVLVAQMLFSIAKWMAKNYAVSKCYSDASDRYHEKIANADFDMFTSHSMSKIYNTAGFLNSITNAFIETESLILQISNIIFLLLAMFEVGGWLILPIIGIYAIGAVVIRSMYKSYSTIDKERNVLYKKRDQETEDMVDGFAEVRSFGRQKYHIGAVRDLNDSICGQNIKKMKLNGKFEGLVDSIEGLSIVLIIWRCVKMMGDGLINAAAAMSLVTFVLKLMDPLMVLLTYSESMSALMAKRKDYEEIMGYSNKMSQNPRNVELESFTDKIEFKNVSFKYGSNSIVVNNLSMVIEKGQHIGICGASGGGKSTIFKLLNNFYSADSGIITVDGYDINDISHESLHRAMGCVHQQNCIFPKSIKENVRYGNPKASDSEIVDACKRANIYDFIQSLPEKFDTEVGPRGLTLSGGQQQRIALARLFLQDPQIYCLDEATSALDNESERFVQDAISQLKGKTVITIAHRLTTIRECDKIFVIDDGKIAEVGTHDELMELKGKYWKMINK